MTIKQQYDETDEIYFVSITCYNWLNLFQLTDFYSEIYKWFNFLLSNEKKIIGYVIMPNHLHVLIYIPEKSETINKVVSEGKRFMAYRMVSLLKDKSFDQLEKYLHFSVNEFEKIRGKKHNIFISNSDIKPCNNEELIIQKLDYIHANPVNGKWNLVDDFTKYEHSSASFYELNLQGVFDVTDYRDIL